MLSKKTLLPMLIDGGFIPNERNVGFEAFGRKVFAFIHVKDMETRTRLAQTLARDGAKVNRSYCPGRPVVEVQVSYFKAWHHDE